MGIQLREVEDKRAQGPRLRLNQLRKQAERRELEERNAIDEAQKKAEKAEAAARREARASAMKDVLRPLKEQLSSWGFPDAGQTEGLYDKFPRLKVLCERVV